MIFVCKNKFHRRLKLAFLAALLGGGNPWGARLQAGPPVPAEYQDLAAELTTKIDEFHGTLQSAWDGTKHPVHFGAEFQVSDCHAGTALLQQLNDPRVYQAAVLLQMARMRELGVQSLTLMISYPLLYPPFHDTPGVGAYQDYLNYYKKVVSDMRSMGLTVVIKSQAIFSQGGWTTLPVGPFYDGQTLQEYTQGRQAVIKTIARELRPDYLVVVAEPDTEEEQQSGKPVNGPNITTALARYYAQGAREENIPGMKIGAGVGAWQNLFQLYVSSMAKAPELDFINVHVYPIHRDFQNNALVIMGIAQAHGKGLSLGETWLYKARESELGSGSNAASVAAFRRDAFSFWEPLDLRHLQNMVDFGHYAKMEFISPFFQRYFFAYVDYNDQTKDLPISDLYALQSSSATVNILSGRFSGTGLGYGRMISREPPAPPTGLRLRQSTNP